jgi:hypothetical protein
MAERPKKKASLSGLHGHPMADPRSERIWFARGTVAHELDADHKALLTNIAHLGQLQERLEQPLEEPDLWLELVQCVFDPEDIQIFQCYGAPKWIAGVAMAMKKRFELLIFP